jgi:hypothetical protein
LLVLLLLLCLEPRLLVRVDELEMLWVFLEVVLFGLFDAVDFGAEGDELVLVGRGEGPLAFGVCQSADLGLETWQTGILKREGQSSCDPITKLSSMGGSGRQNEEGRMDASVSSPPVSFLRVITSRTFFRSSLF